MDIIKSSWYSILIFLSSRNSLGLNKIELKTFFLFRYIGFLNNFSPFLKLKCGILFEKSCSIKLIVKPWLLWLIKKSPLIFIGFSSNLVIGVYIGFDNPKTLGKFETGSKAALPIFKEFIENALYKDDFKEFEIPNNIFLTSLNYDTGLKTTSKDKSIIIEALKQKDINNINNNNLISVNDRDTIVKFRQFY